MNTTHTSVAIAPSHPEGIGSRTPGGHYQAYKAQPLFALDATLRLVTTACRWRPMSPGAAFYASVLAKSPATVGDAIKLGAEAGLKPREVQNHLRWLYTWAGDLEVNGVVYAPRTAEPVAPTAPVKAKGKKAK